MSDIEDNPPTVLLPCTICSRTFRPEVLERHVKVCEKTTSKKRRVFDSFKSRVSGTELEEFLGPAPLVGQAPRRPTRSPVKKRAPSKWKETHENLIATLRAARGVEPPTDTMIEVPKPAGNEQCPSCNRYFGPRAFDRHVEFCKEKTARIKLMPSKVSQAQERLEARTKYRAPLSLKPKLTTKEKYSPMLSRKESTESCSVSTSSAKTSPPVPTLSRNLKPVRQNSSSFSRQSPIRSSERQRSVSPMKKLVTSSKINAKSEAQTKTINQPKVKENLKSSEDFRPRTGTKVSTQEKIRRSNPKLPQLEDEAPKEFNKIKKKERGKFALKNIVPSDNESIESEKSENRDKQGKKSQKWSSAESLNRTKQVFKKKERTTEETEKIILDLTNLEKSQPKIRTELKSARKNKNQKPQINDLSVNDGSFGIFVAACAVRPPSSSGSKTSLKAVNESPKKKNTNNQTEMKKHSAKTVKKGRPHSEKKTIVQEVDHNIENKPPSDSVKAAKEERTNRTDKISKIPKPKTDLQIKKVEKAEIIDSASEILSTECRISEAIEESQEMSKSVDADISREEEIKIKTKKWRNITEIPTEELAHLSEDFEIPENYENEELNESEIWEIAAKQFLKSDELNQSTSAFSVDSLTENYDKNLQLDITFKKPTSNEDDLIVLHVADPAKLMENDADMKLSVSEPCFTYAHSTRKLKKKTPENKKVDIVVFTAFPSAIQTKVVRCKRKKEKKSKKSTPPKLSHIREKTFLASDIPKPKRRKMIKQNNWESRFVDLSDYFINVPSKEEIEERKAKFVDGLKHHRKKIRKWQIRANSHIKFMEEFQKSIENDLKELKNLSKGKKTIRRPSLDEFKREQIKKMQEEREKMKIGEKERQVELKLGGRKFAYFEINFMDEINLNEEELSALEKKSEFSNAKHKEKNSSIGTAAEKSNSSAGNYKQFKTKKFECFEIANDNPKAKANIKKDKKVEIKLKKKLEELSESTTERLHSEMVASDSMMIASHQNSSLENIEEVDESLEEEKVAVVEKDIEIENFILSKPNAQKILSKEDNCLEELFPKPQKSSEVVRVSKISAMSVKLGFTADSVFDLKSNEERKLKGLLKMSKRESSTRMLQKRFGKESKLPQIFVKSNEQKENSLISLIEVWKSKKGSSEKEQVHQTKATLPIGKLPPLTNKNSFQIGANTNDSYDPFKQAERQMLALLSWPSTADIKTAKNPSPTSKVRLVPQQISNLETSPTSAFTKYPKKDDKSAKNEKTNAKKNLNETFEVNETSKKNSLNGKPVFAAADDWEQIFEKHFDLNRNEMTEKMTRSVKSALDGLLKNAIKNKSNSTEEEMSPQKSKDELTQNSIITEILYTSTPKQNSDRQKADRNSKTRSKDSTVDLDDTPNTYRKNSNFIYGRITPPEDFNDLGKTKKKDKNNRYSGISLSSLSFCSQISDTTLADEEVMRSNLEIIGKAAAAAAARSPRRKYARSQSVFDERNKMLFAKTYDPNCSSSDENDVEVLPKIIDKQGKKSPSRNPNPKFSPSHFHRSQSVMDGKYKGDGDHSEEGDHVSSPESNRNRKAKLSGDSAYSSLNRKSRQSTQRNPAQEDRLSSSGSEHSLPNIDDYEPKQKSMNFDNPSPSKKDSLVKMSKFCHECGSKYPVAVAKFCCECGVRRLII